MQGQASQSPGHRDEIWDKAQHAGMGSGGGDQIQDGAWEPGESPGCSSASRAAGTGAGTLTWNAPAAFQQLHQADGRAGSSGESHEPLSYTFRAVTEFQNVPFSHSDLRCDGLCFFFFQCWNSGICSNIAVSGVQGVV